MIAALVLSHWVLDVLTHRPDMPITLTDSSPIGFGLWNYPVVAVPLELLLFGVGIWMYIRHTKPLNRQGSIGFWALSLFLLVVYAASLLDRRHHPRQLWRGLSRQHGYSSHGAFGLIVIG